MPIPQTPPTSWRAVLPVLSRACCSFPVACTEPLAARRCWVRPALSEEFAFSSYLRKGLYDLRGGFSRMVPSAARPDLRLLRAAFALSSTATRASPLRVRGGITRDGALSTCRCVWSLWERLGFLVAGGGEGPCTRPRARYPPHRARGRRGTGGFGRAAVGSRSHPPPRFPRALRRVCVPPTRAHVPATLAARSCRVWCVPRALGRLRLPPRPPLPRQRSHGRWRSREPSYPPFPLRGALEGP